MDLVKGEAEVFPKPGRSFDPALIPKAIKAAGFSAPEVTVTADGVLVQRKEFLELNIPGIRHSFLLAEGAQAGSLKKRADLLGKKIRVTGKLHPSHGDLVPGLTVEDFQPAPQ